MTNVKISHAVSENLKNPRVSFSLVVEGWCVYFDMEGFSDSEVDFAWRSKNGRHSVFDVLGSDLLRVLGLVVVFDGSVLCVSGGTLFCAGHCVSDILLRGSTPRLGTFISVYNVVLTAVAVNIIFHKYVLQLFIFVVN